MPNRIIKESICTSEDIDQLTDAEEAFFYRLIVNCDDYGLLDARPQIIKSRCYPLKSIEINCIQAMVERLQAVGICKLYQVDGKPYLSIVNWAKHQQIRAKRAKCPLPEDGSAITCYQSLANVPVIQSNPNPIQSKEANASVTSVEKPPEDDPVPCPVEKLIEAYHEAMPNNPRCKVLNDPRRRSIRQRWREAARLRTPPFGYTTQADGVLAWRTFFTICAESEFLTGKVPGRAGAPPFVADVDFLFSPSGFAKVLENKYHRGPE